MIQLKSRNNISNSNTQPTNRRGLYEQQAYRQTLINSSKTCKFIIYKKFFLHKKINFFFK